MTEILPRTGEKEAFRGTFQPDPGTLQIFLDERVLTVDLESGVVKGELARRRFLLWAINALHLNQAALAQASFPESSGILQKSGLVLQSVERSEKVHFSLQLGQVSSGFGAWNS